MKIAIFADDLTGANATGVRLSKQGFSTMTVVYGASPPVNDYDALCFDTDSRYSDPETAKMRLLKALQSIPANKQPQVFCKRIDSTLRGNIGTEIDTLLDELGTEAIAIVAAAFPESGRVTIGDYLMVNGVPLQETDVARDPVSPLASSRVTDIIGKQSLKAITSIRINKVLEGKETLVFLMNKKAKEGNRIIVMDAVTEEHIRIIAEAISELKRPVVAVDPGPLTAALANTKFEKVYFDKKILAVIGSVTVQTTRQVQDLIDKWKVHPIYVKPENLATITDRWQQEVDRAVEKTLERVNSESIILVTTVCQNSKFLDLQEIAEQENTKRETLAKRITDGLAAVSQQIIERHPGLIGGCFLSGGDVTASVCSYSRASGIELEDEVLPLAAYGRLRGGFLDGMKVVTKGGMIGNDAAISDCIRYLITKLSNYNS